MVPATGEGLPVTDMAQIPVPVPTSSTFFGFSVGARNSLLSNARYIIWWLVRALVPISVPEPVAKVARYIRYIQSLILPLIVRPPSERQPSTQVAWKVTKAIPVLGPLKVVVRPAVDFAVLEYRGADRGGRVKVVHAASNKLGCRREASGVPAYSSFIAESISRGCLEAWGSYHRTCQPSIVMLYRSALTTSIGWASTCSGVSLAPAVAAGGDAVVILKSSLRTVRDN